MYDKDNIMKKFFLLTFFTLFSIISVFSQNTRLNFNSCAADTDLTLEAVGCKGLFVYVTSDWGVGPYRYKTNSDSTISPNNPVSIWDYSHVVWDSTLSNTSQAAVIGWKIPYVGPNSGNPSAFLFWKMSSKVANGFTGYGLQINKVAGTDKHYLLRCASGVNSTVVIDSISSEISNNDSVFVFIAKGGTTQKVFIQHSGGTRDSLINTDVTYNPTSGGYTSLRSLMNTAMKFDNFMLDTTLSGTTTPPPPSGADTTDPTVVSYSASPSSFTVGVAGTFTISTTDNHSIQKIVLVIDAVRSDSVTYTSPWATSKTWSSKTFTYSSTGSHTYAFIVNDSVGNSVTTANKTLQVQTSSQFWVGVYIPNSSWGTFKPNNIDWTNSFTEYYDFGSYQVRQSLSDSTLSPWFGPLISASESIAVEFKYGWTQSLTRNIQRECIDSAHAHGVKAFYTLTAVKYYGYSTTLLNWITQDSVRCETLTSAMVDYAQRKGFDGIDLNWEYVSASERDNYLRFTRFLRRKLDLWTPVGLLAHAMNYTADLTATTGNIVQSGGLYVDQLNTTFDRNNIEMYGLELAGHAWWGHEFAFVKTNVDAGAIGTYDAFTLVDSVVAGWRSGPNGYINRGVTASKIGVLVGGLTYHAYRVGKDILIGGASGDAPYAMNNIVWPDPTFNQDVYLRDYANIPEQWDSTAKIHYKHWYDAPTNTYHRLGYQDSLSVIYKINYMKERGLGGTGMYDLWDSYIRPTVLPGFTGDRWRLTHSIMNTARSGAPNPILPGIPILILPTTSDTTVQLSDIQFKWNSVSGATSYEFQLDSVTLFTTPIISYIGLIDTANTLIGQGNLQQKKTYYWRVRAVNSAGQGQYSSVFNFKTIQSSVTVPGAPTINYPGSDTTITSTSSAITWTVTAADSAITTSYNLQIATNSGFTQNLQSSYSGTKTALISNLSAGTIYYVRVAALNGIVVGTYSSTRIITVATSTPPPTYTGQTSFPWWDSTAGKWKSSTPPPVIIVQDLQTASLGNIPSGTHGLYGLGVKHGSDQSSTLFGGNSATGVTSVTSPNGTITVTTPIGPAVGIDVATNGIDSSHIKVRGISSTDINSENIPNNYVLKTSAGNGTLVWRADSTGTGGTMLYQAIRDTVNNPPTGADTNIATKVFANRSGAEKNMLELDYGVTNQFKIFSGNGYYTQTQYSNTFNYTQNTGDIGYTVTPQYWRYNAASGDTFRIITKDVSATSTTVFGIGDTTGAGTNPTYGHRINFGIDNHGIPNIVGTEVMEFTFAGKDSVTKSNQTLTISATALVNTTTAGIYRIWAYIEPTTTDATATVTVTFDWSNAVHTKTSGSLALAAVANYVDLPIQIYHDAAASSSIRYSTTVTSIGTGQYRLIVTCEKLK